MRVGRILIVILLVLVAGAAVSAFAIQRIETTKVDIVAINEAVKTIEGKWDQGPIGSADYASIKQPVTVIDSRGTVLYQTDSELPATVNEAIKNRDTVVDLLPQGDYAGKLIIHHRDTETLQQIKRQLMTVWVLAFAVLAILGSLYVLYLNAVVFQPFKRLQSFALRVAGGVLDVPLVRDKANPFGAFTESFDLMREELDAARRREYEANRSKKELVASLSHDIRTPVASIKAVTELMLLQTADDKATRQLNTINAKAEQINLLVTDMFHAALEELQELKVTVTEEPSTILTDMIGSVNIDQPIHLQPIPACLLLIDAMRLRQVLDNILSNAHKYAGTPVTLAAQLNPTHLELYVMDDGPGINPDELPLVFNKFYRGHNAEGKDGAGLGLYISRYFMQNMQGDIICRNRPDGFTVVLLIKLA